MRFSGGTFVAFLMVLVTTAVVLEWLEDINTLVDNKPVNLSRAESSTLRPIVR